MAPGFEADMSVGLIGTPGRFPPLLTVWELQSREAEEDASIPPEMFIIF